MKVSKQKREILVSITPYDKRTAVLQDGELMELVVESHESKRTLGNVYKGIVQKVLPGLQAAFVEIGQEKAGFLHVDDVIDRNIHLYKEYGRDEGDVEAKVERPLIDQLLKEGQELMVQVIKEPISTKGARLTTHLAFPGRFLVCMPGTDFVGVSKKERDGGRRRDLKRLVKQLKGKGVGYIVRTNGLNASDAEVQAQMEQLEERWQATRRNFENTERGVPALLYEESTSTEATLREYFSENTDFVYVDDIDEYRSIKSWMRALSPEMVDRVKLWSDDEGLFETFHIENEYETSLQRKVPLRRGGYLIIEQTEALVSIDVNTGHKVQGQDQAKNIVETNIDAAEEIAKQMRLRDMGGLIIIDFIDMETEEDKDRVVQAFKKAVRKDKSPVSFIPLTPFCLMEVTRKRVRMNLLTQKTDVCPTCQGRGFVYANEVVLYNLDRWLGRAAKHKADRKIALLVGPSLSEYLLEDRGRFFKYLEDRHKMTIDLYEEDSIGVNEFRVFDARSGDELTEKYSI